VSKVNTTNKKSIQATIIEAGKSVAFPLLAIFISIFVAVFFVMWAKGYSILQYFTALTDLFRIIWTGCFGDQATTLNTIMFVTPLIFTGVAHSVAFRTGLFNIGVEGQFIVGMLACSLLGLIPGLSPVIHIPLILIGGVVAGSIWAAIPGYLKAKVGTNEVINTIMMNYLSMALVNFVVLRTAFGEKGKANTPMIKGSAMLMNFSGSRANVGVFIAIAVAIFIAWLLWKTTIGYEVRAVGINPYGAEYGGVNIAKNTVLAMVISGAIAGLGGAAHVSGVMHQQFDLTTVPGFGFDGIAVALLAKNHPIGCIASAVLFGALNASSKMLQLNDIPKEIVYLIQAVIIIFVATDYIVRYFAEKKKKKEAMGNA